VDVIDGRQRDPAGQKKTSVWLLTNSPSPYQVELCRELQQLGGVELNLRFMRGDFRGDCERSLDGVPHSILSGFGLSRTRDELRIHPGAIWETLRARDDVYVLSGLYTSPTFLICAVIIWLRRRPLVLWLERPGRAMRPDLSWWIGLLRIPLMVVRKAVLRFLFAICTRLICMGNLAAREYAELGAAEKKIRNVPYCCDVERFSTVSGLEAAEVRERYGIEDRVLFLHSGQLIKRKGVDDLVAAFRQVAKQCDDVALLLLGDGPLRTELEHEAASIDAPVIFAGHQQQSMLPAFFRAADLFVIASRHDGWGVVVNEACGAGLPVIASKQTGSAHDLIIPGVNGIRFEAGNVADLAAAMRQLAEDSALRQAYGSNSMERVKDYTSAAGARRLCDVLLELPR
jgi:glycosyltransferase involved in cell wall biosynthesis